MPYSLPGLRSQLPSPQQLSQPYPTYPEKQSAKTAE